MPEGTGGGSATTNISANAAGGCGGIFGLYGNVGGTTTNALDIVIPPEILIRELWGEAYVQALAGDQVSELSIGNAIRQRLGDHQYFRGFNNYQDMTTALGFDGLLTCGTGCLAGVQHKTETINAALIYGGANTSTTGVEDSKCFMSPTPSDWQKVNNALITGTTAFPILSVSPHCWSPANRQIVYKQAVGNNVRYPGSATPAFLFEQWRTLNSPASYRFPRGGSMESKICFALLFAALSVPGFSETGNAQASEANAQARHASYLQLNRQMYARHEDSGSGQMSDTDLPKATLQLHQMVVGEIGLALGAPQPAAAGIATAISNLQGEITLSAWGEEGTNTPYASIFTLNHIPTAAVAYVIMEGGDATPDTQPYLEFYDKASGEWQVRASAPTLADFEGCTFTVSPLDPGVPGESWFLVWGTGFANSHATIHLRLYSFDGYGVRTIWKRDRLDAGHVKVNGNAVTLDYIDWDDRVTERHEVLHVTAAGLQ